MYNYAELSLARKDMLCQSKMYQPTYFWEQASQIIEKELCTKGIRQFRSIPTALSYFVPTYGIPGNCFTKEIVKGLSEKLRRLTLEKKPKHALEQYLHGKINALADYRVLLAADNQNSLPHLHTFSESNFGRPVEQFEFDGRKFSRSSLNYLLGLSLLKKHLKGEVPKTILEIGGGFGTLGEIFSCSGIKEYKYIDIDIPPTSFVAQIYLSNVLGAKNVATYKRTRKRTTIKINSLPQTSVLCSWQIEKLMGRVDLFVNFISFQEMEPVVVKNYLSHVTRLRTKWILLRNMREGKNIRKGRNRDGVEIPIHSDDYLAMLSEYELVDRNVVPFGYKTVDGYHSELLLLKRKK